MGIVFFEGVALVKTVTPSSQIVSDFNILGGMNPQKPSSTANIVAQNIAFIGTTESRLLPNEAIRINAFLVADYSASGSFFLKNLSYRWFQKLFRLYVFLTIPGLALHQALRKIHIERAVRRGLKEGFRQVVVLGGGLDTLAARLHKEFSEVSFFELDHPATQHAKADSLRKHGLVGENLKLLPADFTTQDWSIVLNSNPLYDFSAKTIFICEGVTMYLAEDEVSKLFDAIKHSSNAANRFIFSFLEPDSNGELTFRDTSFAAKLWLKWKNEPFKWGISRKEIKRFVAGKGFKLSELTVEEDFKRRYLSKGRLRKFMLAAGENICICENS